MPLCNTILSVHRTAVPHPTLVESDQSRECVGLIDAELPRLATLAHRHRLRSDQSHEAKAEVTEESARSFDSCSYFLW